MLAPVVSSHNWPQPAPARAMHAATQTLRRLPFYLVRRKLTQSAALPLAEPAAVSLVSSSSCSISSSDEDTERAREPLQLHVPIPLEKLLSHALWRPPLDGTRTAASVLTAPIPSTAFTCTVQKVVFAAPTADFAVLKVAVPDRQFWPQLSSVPGLLPVSSQVPAPVPAPTVLQTHALQPSPSRAARHFGRRMAAATRHAGMMQQVAVPSSTQLMTGASQQVPAPAMQPAGASQYQQQKAPTVLLCGRDQGLRRLATPNMELFVRGRWSQHKTYGTQLEVEEARAVKAENASAEAAASGPRPLNGSEDFEDTGLTPIDLVAARMSYLRLRNSAKHEQRKSITLSVTDLTSAGWCGLQLAYQTATGERKKQTAQMAQGGDIHENLELEVVQKVEVVPVTAEDEMAISLLNAVAAIRQLLVEGRTRELRVFAPMQGQWIVGVIDGVDYDADKHVVSLLENKTRSKRGMPAPEQVDSNRLQVMVYHDLYNMFRHLSLHDIEDYLYHHSSTGVGLRPDMPLSMSILELCGHLFPVRSTPGHGDINSNGHAEHNGVLGSSHHAHNNGIPNSGQHAHSNGAPSSGALAHSHATSSTLAHGSNGFRSGNGVSSSLAHDSNGHEGASLSMHHASQDNGPSSSSPAKSAAGHVVAISKQAQQHSPVKSGSQRARAAGQRAIKVSTPTSSSTPILPQTDALFGASPSSCSQPMLLEQQQGPGQSVDQQPAEEQPTEAQQHSLESRGSGKKKTSKQRAKQQTASEQSSELSGGEQPAKKQHVDEQQQATQQTPAAVLHQPLNQLPLLTPSTDGHGEQVVRLSDCVRLLHDSLAWLPPPGQHHSLQYIWQQDPTEVLGCVNVEYDTSWLQPRLQKALDVWAGRRTPQPVTDKQDWKCKFCDFKEQCKKHHPEHPLSDPHKLYEQCLAQKQQEIKDAAAARAELLKNGNGTKKADGSGSSKKRQSKSLRTSGAAA